MLAGCANSTVWKCVRECSTNIRPRWKPESPEEPKFVSLPRRRRRRLSISPKICFRPENHTNKLQAHGKTLLGSLLQPQHKSFDRKTWSRTSTPRTNYWLTQWLCTAPATRHSFSGLDGHRLQFCRQGEIEKGRERRSSAVATQCSQVKCVWIHAGRLAGVQEDAEEENPSRRQPFITRIDSYK